MCRFPDEPAAGLYHWILLGAAGYWLYVINWPTVTGKVLDKVKGTAGRKWNLFSVVIGMFLLWYVTSYSHLYSSTTSSYFTVSVHKLGAMWKTLTSKPEPLDASDQDSAVSCSESDADTTHALDQPLGTRHAPHSNPPTDNLPATNREKGKAHAAEIKLSLASNMNSKI